MISRYVHRSKFVRRELAKIDKAIKRVKSAGGVTSINLIHKVHKLIDYSCG